MPEATAISIATRASTAGQRRLRSERVRCTDVAQSPRTDTVSLRETSQRRTLSPSRDRIPELLGTAISTGLLGLRSRPKSHAAVAPAKTDSGGSNRCHAERRRNGSTRTPLQQYSSAPRRRHALPPSALE